MVRRVGEVSKKTKTRLWPSTEQTLYETASSPPKLPMTGLLLQPCGSSKPPGIRRPDSAVQTIGKGELTKGKITKTPGIMLGSWLEGRRQGADGLANTKDLRDSRSVVHYSLTVSLGQGFLCALPLFQHTPGLRLFQCLVIHTGAVGEREGARLNPVLDERD